MQNRLLIGDIESSRKFFERSISVLTEEDSGFSPNPEMYTVAQQVAHVARTIEWFMEGAFGGSGWDMDFEAHIREAQAIESLQAAREWLARACNEAIAMAQGLSDEVLLSTFPADDPIMPGALRMTIAGAIVDHTAHHRGALTVYARLLGKVPPMPYM